MTIRYLLWHMDGALFDTTPTLRRALHDSLRELGAVPNDAELNILLMQTTAPFLTAAATLYGVDFYALSTRFHELYDSVLLREQPPHPGAVNLCVQMVQSGGQNYVYTEREYLALERFLAAYGMLDLFAGWLSADEQSAAPDFLMLLRAADLSPKTTLLISSIPQDIWNARQAGLKTCLYGPKKVVEADYVLTSYRQLAGHLFMDTAQVVS